MSQSGDDEINRREVAYRLFAAEFDDADLSYAESDEERAPNYVVTPTGARVNRLFVVGVLTEVEQVNDDVVRARVVDPTGAFVVYAGQYQPEALAALESADTPSFVAVTGKARTFQPDDADVVYTSIRPESVSEVDAATRDRWVVTTAEQTVDRVATMAGAHARVERGDTLQRVLEDAGVQNGLTSGIPLALDHYETTPTYLDAVRNLALDAARVVSGDLESAGALEYAPDQGGDTPLDFAREFDVTEQPATDDTGASVDENAEATEATEATGSASGTESGEPAESSGEEPTDAEETSASSSPAAETPSPSDVAEEATPEDDDSESKPEPADAGEDETTETGDAAEASEDDGEMYELSEEERQEVEENYDVGFSSGDEIPDAGEADLDAPEPEEAEADETGSDDAAVEATEETEAVADGSDDDLGDFDDGDGESVDSDDDPEDEDEEDDLDDFTEDEYDEPESDSEDSESPPPDLDLEDYVVDLMEELDDGDGAPRDEVITTAADERDADEGEIEDAIQDALMSGRCYESGDDHLKAI